MTEYHEELDACGLTCPVPLLKAKLMLRKMASGHVLKIIATDPGSVEDFKVFARQTGNDLLESSEADGKYLYLMRKG